MKAHFRFVQSLTTNCKSVHSHGRMGMPYPTTTMTLTPREIELIVIALHESADDRQQWDEPDTAAEYVTLQRRFVKASNDLITH